MLKQSGQHKATTMKSPQITSTVAAQQRKHCHLLTTATVILSLLCCASLCAVATADDEVVSSQPRAIFKNEEFLSRKKIPDVQGVLQKPSTDKKFENLNAFLAVLKNALAEAGYQASPG